MAADRVILWTTAEAVIGVAVVAAVASNEHAYDLVRAHGDAGWTARLVPLTVDGLIYASSMVILDCARRKVPIPALARWLLGVGITTTLAANVARVLGHGLMGAAAAAVRAPPRSLERSASPVEPFTEPLNPRREQLTGAGRFPGGPRAYPFA